MVTRIIKSIPLILSALAYIALAAFRVAGVEVPPTFDLVANGISAVLLAVLGINWKRPDVPPL